MVAISIIILIICGLLALVVLAQNPKGGGLASGFTGASQIGGVQRTADFLEKSTWTLSGALMVLCLVSAGLQGGSSSVAMLQVAEGIVRSIVAAPMASPAPVVVIGGRRPAQPVDYRTG